MSIPWEYVWISKVKYTPRKRKLEGILSSELPTLEPSQCMQSVFITESSLDRSKGSLSHPCNFLSYSTLCVHVKYINSIVWWVQCSCKWMSLSILHKALKIEPAMPASEFPGLLIQKILHFYQAWERIWMHNVSKPFI